MMTINTLHPVTPLQAGILVHELTGVAGAAYLNHLEFDLVGAVDHAALAWAFDRVVERHEALRTSFHWEEADEPLAVVHDRVDSQVRVHGATSDPSALVAELIARPMDTSCAGLTRVDLIPMDATTTRVLWTHHHLVLDGWSLAVVFGEVLELYRGRGRSTEPSLAPAVPHRAVVESAPPPDPARVEYWRQTVTSGAAGRLSVGQSRQQAGYGQVVLPLSTEDLDGLRLVSEAAGATLAALVEVLWASVLDRYCGGTGTVMFGTVVSGRERLAGDLGGAVGMLVNTIPVVVEVDPRSGLEAALRCRMEERRGRAMHGSDSLSDISRWAGFDGGEFFDTLLVIENFPVGDLTLPDGLEMVPVRALERTHYPVTVTVFAGANPRVEIDHRTEKVSDEVATNMAELLGSAIAEVRAGRETVGGLVLLPPAPVHDDPHPSAPSTVVEAFVATAVARPAAPAVIGPDGSTTYRELHDLARSVAGWLATQGVEAGQIVSVALPRGRELAAALLGVLGAGCAYLAHDPGGSISRQVADGERAGAVLVLDSHAMAEAVSGDARVDLHSDPHALAYVALTSGSTGQPKVVQVGHSMLAKHAAAMATAFALSNLDRVGLFTSPAFDVIAEELYPTWLSGGAVAILGEEARSTPADLARAMDSLGVTVVNLPASWWHLWVGEIDHAPIPSTLRLVVVGDEPVWSEFLPAWQAAREHDVELLNAYGTTETTITTTVHRVLSGDPTGTMLPIGRPLQGMRVDLVDQRDRLVPHGALGELLIGGSGVGLGYRGQPRATAERFVPDARSRRPGARAYRTGDRGFRDSTGAITLVGRVDDQVQVRGHRVEPAEVEEAIASDPAVGQVVVLGRLTEGSGAHLEAHLTAVAGQANDLAGLRDRLMSRLPAHQVPTHLRVWAALPTTSSGKVDRAALTAASPDVLPGAPMPATATEQWVIDTWREVLGTGAITRDSSFFASGGDSLKATQLTGRIRRAFLTSTTVGSVLAATTVADLARRIDSEIRARSGRSEATPPTPAGPDDAPALSFTQERLWFLDRLGGETGAYNLTCAWRFESSVDSEALRSALAHVVGRHDALRSVFPEVDGAASIRVRPRVPVDLALGELPSETAALETLLAQEAASGFDLEAGPLFRFRLLRGRAEDVFVATVHHIVIDGWSLSLFVNEVGRAYADIRDGVLEPSEGPRLQAPDLARWQRQRAEAGALTAASEYWEGRLTGAPTLLNLPLDRSRASDGHRRPGRRRFALDSELTLQVRDLARDGDTTVYAVLLAAYTAVLHRYCRQDDLLVGTPVAGRTVPESESVLGCLVNTLALRSTLDGSLGFADHLDRIRTEIHGALEHQDMPFEHLVSTFVTERDLAHEPLVQTMFLFQNTPRGELRLGPARGRGLEMVEPTKMDLILTLAEEGSVIEGLWEYDASVLDPGTIERLQAALEALLRAASQDPDRPLRAVPVDDPTLERELHRERLVDPELVPALLPRWAVESPTAPAVVGPTMTLSHADLGEAAHAVAHCLQRRGVTRADVVGIVGDGDTDIVAMMYGVWLAGAAYVPLEPDQPIARLRQVADLAGVDVILTSSAWVHMARDITETVVVGEGVSEQRCSHRVEVCPSLVGVEGHDLAYILFTSGSTGQPKGVRIDHGALAALASAMSERQEITAGDRALLAHRLGFDASIFSIVPVLTQGGSVVVPGPELRRDPRLVPRVVAEHGVSLLFLTASQLAVLVDEDPGWSPPTLRTIANGGEALPGGLAQQVRVAAPNVGIENHYGPTEATVGVASARLDSSEDLARPAIGEAFVGCTIALIDEGGREVIPGARGEIAIGGAQLAQGYVGRPAETADRFRPDPASSRPGARRYLTGDLARRRPAGALEHLGRMDRQVKVRGHRIEPGEVESALLRSEVVRGAHVYADRQRLLAYVAAPPDTGPSILDELRAVLPAHLVPDRLHVVDEIPLTANGKVDTDALRRREPDDDVGQEPAAPGLQSEIAELMAQLLGVSALAANDDFFARGGHSLLALRLVGAVSAQFGVNVALRDVFARSTVAGLAEVVTNALLEQADRAEIEAALAEIEGTAEASSTALRHNLERQP